MTCPIHIKLDFARMIFGLLPVVILIMAGVAVATVMIELVKPGKMRLNHMKILGPVIVLWVFISVAETMLKIQRMEMARAISVVVIILTVHVTLFTTMECCRMRLVSRLLNSEMKG